MCNSTMDENDFFRIDELVLRREVVDLSADERIEFLANADAYGTVKGRRPSLGNRPVGPLAEDGWARNM
jgi:hypothetical protein